MRTRPGGPRNRSRGKPAKNAYVAVQAAPSRSARVGPDGRFRIEAIPAGRYAVAVHLRQGEGAPRLLEFGETGEVTADFEVRSGGTTLALTVPRGLAFFLLQGEVPLPTDARALDLLIALAWTRGQGDGRRAEKVEHLPPGLFTLLLFKAAGEPRTGRTAIARHVLTVGPDPVQSLVVPPPATFTEIVGVPDSGGVRY